MGQSSITAFLRPDVVWFGEELLADSIHAAMRASDGCDLFLSVGTSSVVYPAAMLPEMALRRTTVIEINPDETPLTASASYSLRGPAGEILPALARIAAAR